MLALALLGCSGRMITPAPAGTKSVPSANPSVVPSPDKATVETCKGVVSPGPSPLRRLSRREYNNTVEDLLGLKTDIGLTTLSADPTTRGFDNNANVQTVSENQAESYMNAAEKLAALANLTQLAPCYSTATTATARTTCAKGFIESLGRRAYRRPLTEDDLNKIYAVTSGVLASGATFEAAMRATLEAMLQMPMFLYRWEDNDTLVSQLTPVTASAVASRLSYALWGTMPDAELFRAADAGELSDPAKLQAQVTRLLASPRSHAQVASFHDQWLQLALLDAVEKDTSLYPTWASTRPSVKTETQTFLDYVFWQGKDVRQVLTADFTFVDAKAAVLYGLPPPAAGFEKRTLPGTRRGLLGQASMLAMAAHGNQTSPVLRGKLVRQSLLCQDLPPPPAGINTTVTDPSPTSTTRERFAQHRADPVCASCHQLMDPVGLGLENFDAVGAWRDTEAGKPIDASGEVIGASDANGVFAGGQALGEKLAASNIFQECMVKQWFRFTFGRLETPQDVCTIVRGRAAMMGAGGDMASLLVSLTNSDPFLYRAPEVQ